MDDVRTTIEACNTQSSSNLPHDLEQHLNRIPTEYSELTCHGFEELITEFLDGFVPARTYHLFEDHSENCQNCSELLTGVVYAVAACHSVHTFEEVEAPAPLVEQLVAIAAGRARSLSHRFTEAVGRFAEHLIPRTTQTWRWTFATAASLSLASIAFLLFGFSDDGSFTGVYRQAHVRASELYTQSADIYTETDKVVARLERVGKGIGEIWNTLGGEQSADGKAGNKPEPNSNTPVKSPERN